MAKHKISISFKRKYHDVYVYLSHLKENHENISDYICKLVQADMCKEHQASVVSRAEIERMVLETLLKNSQPVQLDSASPSDKQEQDKLSKEDIELLNNIF